MPDAQEGRNRAVKEKRRVFLCWRQKNSPSAYEIVSKRRTRKNSHRNYTSAGLKRLFAFTGRQPEGHGYPRSSPGCPFFL